MAYRKLILITLTGFLALTAFSLSPLPCGSEALAASNSCLASCKVAYGDCYKSTNADRRSCSKRLQRCLQRCSKRN